MGQGLPLEVGDGAVMSWGTYRHAVEVDVGVGAGRAGGVEPQHGPWLLMLLGRLEDLRIFTLSA